jgi:hypothetical protein
VSDKNLVKVYSDRTYVSTTVRHDGTMIAFAMSADRRIYYSVLDLTVADRRCRPLDVACWNDDPALLPFPSEITDPAVPAPAPAAMPLVRLGSLAESLPDRLLPGETDPFLSTTARLTGHRAGTAVKCVPVHHAVAR